MKISDNIIKERLKHVYWIIGTSCAGKTTMAQALAEKYGMTYYETNDHYARFKRIATTTEQPFLSKTFQSAEAYFSQPLPDYVEYIEKQTEEAFEMWVADFLGMNQNTPIITETVHIVANVLPITSYNNIAFLYVQEELYRQQNWQRDDQERRDILGYMQKTSDPEKFMNHLTEMGVMSGRRMIEKAKQLDVAMFERVESTTVEEMLEQLESHFQLRDRLAEKRRGTC